MPWELEAVLGADTARLGLRRLKPIRHIKNLLRPQPTTSFGKVAVLESSLYMRNQLLRDTDWASMAHSLEVRVPLVDVKLLSQLAPTTTRYRPRSKRLLANSPRVPLPAQGDRTPQNRLHNSDSILAAARQTHSAMAASSFACRRAMRLGEALGF